MKEVLVRLNQSSTAAFYTDPILSSWFNQAHKWAAAYKKWPFTEGRSSTTFASAVTSEDGYTVLEYPEGFKSDSIRYLRIGGKKVRKVNFYKFQKFIEDNGSSTDRIFSDYGRRIYINPSIDLSGSTSVWGQFVPADYDYTAAAQNTVFTGGEEEGNEAIVREMLSYALLREKTPTAMVRGNAVSAAIIKHQEASKVLDSIFEKIAEEAFGYESTQDDGMFKRFDVLRGGFTEDLFRRDQFF